MRECGWEGGGGRSGVSREGGRKGEGGQENAGINYRRLENENCAKKRRTREDNDSNPNYKYTR